MSGAASNTQIVPLKERYLTLQGLLEQNRAAIAQACTKHLDASRLTRLALTELRKTPDLLQCAPVSIIASVMQAAQYGLEIGGVLGRAYLVPFRNKHNGNRQECQLIVGYKGYIELAYRSGLVDTVEGSAVFEGDHFDYKLGLDRKLEHVPCGEDDPQKLTHAYAIVRMKGGGVVFTVLTRRAIETIRLRSPGGTTGPWVAHYAEMAVKTAVRRIFKFSPAAMEATIARVVAAEEFADTGYSAEDLLDGDLASSIIVDPVSPECSGGGALNKIVEQERAKKGGPTIRVRGVDGKLINTDEAAVRGEVVDGTAPSEEKREPTSDDGQAARV